MEWGPYRAYLEERFENEEEAQLFTARLRTLWELEAWRMLSEEVRNVAFKSALKYCDLYNRLAKEDTE